MDAPLVIALLALAIALFALWTTLRRMGPSSTPRYRIEAAESRSLDHEGKETVSWSVTYWHDGSWIGAVLCRFHLAKLGRRRRRLRRAIDAATPAGSHDAGREG